MASGIKTFSLFRIAVRHIAACTALTMALVGCGTPGGSSSSNSSATSSSSAASPGLNAGVNQTVHNSQVVTLDASLSAARWQQLQGPTVEWLNRESAQAQFVAPDVSQETELVFEASSDGVSDQVLVTVTPCDASSEMVFDDCVAPGFGAWLAYESGNGAGEMFHREPTGDYHVQWRTLETGESSHGRVMEITWNANDADNTRDARGWFGLTLPGEAAAQGEDWREYADGALSFDMRLVDAQNPEALAGFIFKMECVHPCTSAEMPIAAGNTSYEWRTHTYPIRELVNSGLDLSSLNHVFVIQPDWFAQDQMVTVQVDNIRLTKTYESPEPAEGCTGAGNISYTLGRAANPSADQQEAYSLITAAMDVAVENYNCYTNLNRHLTVEYNPSVQTADGSTNGNIRFGSRASMHHVTAMHEIAHTFGAGGSAAFRNLVVDGEFQGANATAKLREISGDPNALLSTDGTHFWPHGLNYTSEGGSQQDLIHHCWMVEAIAADLGAN